MLKKLAMGVAAVALLSACGSDDAKPGGDIDIDTPPSAGAPLTVDADRDALSRAADFGLALQARLIEGIGRAHV